MLVDIKRLACSHLAFSGEAILVEFSNFNRARRREEKVRQSLFCGQNLIAAIEECAIGKESFD